MLKVFFRLNPLLFNITKAFLQIFNVSQMFSFDNKSLQELILHSSFPFLNQMTSHLSPWFSHYGKYYHKLYIIKIIFDIGIIKIQKREYYVYIYIHCHIHTYIHDPHICVLLNIFSHHRNSRKIPFYENTNIPEYITCSFKNSYLEPHLRMDFYITLGNRVLTHRLDLVGERGWECLGSQCSSKQDPRNSASPLLASKF